MGAAPCCSVCNTQGKLIKEKASLCKNPLVRFPVWCILGEPRCISHETSSQIPPFSPALPQFLQDWVTLRSVGLQHDRENVLKVALKCRNDECCLLWILSQRDSNSAAFPGEAGMCSRGWALPLPFVAEEEQNPCGIQNRNICSYGKEQ